MFKRNQNEEEKNTVNVMVKPSVKTYACVIGISVLIGMLYHCGCDDAAAAIEKTLNEEREKED